MVMERCKTEQGKLGRAANGPFRFLRYTNREHTVCLLEDSRERRWHTSAQRVRRWVPRRPTAASRQPTGAPAPTEQAVADPAPANTTSRRRSCRHFQWNLREIQALRQRLAPAAAAAAAERRRESPTAKARELTSRATTVQTQFGGLLQATREKRKGEHSPGKQQRLPHIVTSARSL